MARRDTIIDRLERLAERIEANAVEREQLYRERDELWAEGNTLAHRLTHKELARPARVSEGAVTQALRKRAKRNGAMT